MSKEGHISIELNIEGVRCIHNGLKQACDKWAGGDPHEQADLLAMRDNFYRLILEHQINGF